MYHRFGENTLPSTNIRLAEFEAHLSVLKSGPYHVLPLAGIVAALAAGRPLPDRAVAITIDDAYLSVYREAFPRLRAAGLPFTLFVATDPLDQKLPGFMSWDQLREIVAGGATVGNHGASHAHMLNASPRQNRRDIAKGMRRIGEELGIKPQFFAYPYGEYRTAFFERLEKAGIRAAFAQYSGVAYGGSPLMALPRFALNEKYGGLDRFRLIVDTLPIPATEITPSDPDLAGEANPPAFGFTLSEEVPGIAALQCFPSHIDAPGRIDRIGTRRIEVRLGRPFPPGRGRINCTSPGPGERWRWLGAPFFVPGGDPADRK